MINDLARLQQELQVETVSLALMQTELFPSQSDDFVSAATRAEQIADQAMTRLPADTKARREVERLKIESILRAGQLDRADQELTRIGTANDANGGHRDGSPCRRGSISPSGGSVRQPRDSTTFLVNNRPFARSMEMDLAKLEFMLRSDPAAASGDWLEAIELRGGVYARRRAEAMALSMLGHSQSSTTPAIDPSIVAAQGQDYLRRGDPGRAAELLAAAAMAETNPDRAIERSAEAAAAFGLVQRHREAAARLAETAIQYPQAVQASACAPASGAAGRFARPRRDRATGADAAFESGVVAHIPDRSGGSRLVAQAATRTASIGGCG